jgi:PAS domain S-box-containing protein
MPKLRSSLQLKFSLGLLTFTIIIFSLISLFFYYQFNFFFNDTNVFKSTSLKKSLSKNFKDKGQSTAKFLSEELVNPLYNLDTENIFYLLKAVKNDPHVKTAYVFDKNGKLIHGGSNNLLDFDQTLEPATIGEISSPQARKVIEMDDQIVISCPIYLEDDKLGFLRLIYSLDLEPSDSEIVKSIISGLKQQADQKNVTLFAILILFILLGSLLLALVLSRGLKKTLVRLSEIAERFGKGETVFTFPKPGTDESGRLVSSFVKMVEQLKTKEERLNESNELFHDLTLTSPIGIWRSDLDGNCLYINNRCSDIIGVSPQNAFGKNWLKNIHPDDKENFSSEWDNAVKEFNNFKYECRYLSPEEKTAEVLGRTIFEKNDSEKVVGYIGTITDITSYKTLEENLKKSLLEKEILLKELHHRIKNNLQVVSGLLHLQEENVKDPQLLNILRESQNRVFSMALVHERILESQNFSEIDIEKYIYTLVNQLLTIYGSNDLNISLDVQVHIKSFDFDKSIYCGLIINELVSNSLKYAFNKNQNNQIKILILNTNSGKTKFIVSDNGVGFPESFCLEDNDSMGLKVVSLLVESQLEGTITLDKNDGAKFKIVF